MANRIENPFVISGYVSPEYFCNRMEETQDIIETLKNGQNVILTSFRRMGKTGLIHHVFHTMQESDKAICIYIDLFPTLSLSDFTHVFASAVLGQMDSTPMKILKQASSLLKGLRPTISMDDLTGTPRIGIDFTPGEEEYTLERIFEYLRISGKTCYIALDEFQQIASYPEKNVEALLRANIQRNHNARFIFSGSQVHMLTEMFLSPKRPFYQSAAHKVIDAIEEDVYYAFAAHHMKAGGGIMDQETFHFLYEKFEGHTWYVQKVLNHLYRKKKKQTDTQLVSEAVKEILADNEYYYQMLLRAYTKGQVKLLKAIAMEGKVREITSGTFISRYGLSATSSVKGALKRLLEDELVCPDLKGYMVYDKFFNEWLTLTFQR